MEPLSHMKSLGHMTSAKQNSSVMGVPPSVILTSLLLYLLSLLRGYLWVLMNMVMNLQIP